MTALVTGGAGGIGAAVVRQLLLRGEEVIAQDVSRDALIVVHGTNIRHVAGDLRDKEVLSRIKRELAQTRLTRVIAAHGIDGSAAIRQVEPSFVARVMAINTSSVIELYEAVHESLAANRGCFTVIASQAALVAEPDNAVYSASKFALIGWARAVRQMDPGSAVALRLLAPGCTETDLMLNAQARFAAAIGMDADEFIRQRKEKIPVRYFASVEQTASAAVYLSEPHAARPNVLATTGGEVIH